jgi:hypothetical protein
MTAFNPIAFAHKLEDAGLSREQSEALANEMRAAMLELVTQEQLKAALDRQTVQLTVIVGGLLALLATLSKVFA